MEFLDDLRREHDLIERVAVSFRAFVRRDDCDAADARQYLRFFTLYAGDWHHEREEKVLFPSLEHDLQLPAPPDHGPIFVLLDDHIRMAGMLSDLRAMCGQGVKFDGPRFRGIALEYTQELLLHIDAENSVLFPECEDRLRRAAIAPLHSRELTRDEEEARAAGEAMAERYPGALNDTDLTRGDGCALCRAYGVTCSGIEREWWNDWEWEEFDEHIAAS
jgi:hemerythrin-like domain-containing protein